MKKTLIVLLMLILVVTGCNSTPKNTGYPVTVNEISFKSPPKRVASFSAAITEQMFLMGYGNKLVATAEGSHIPEAGGEILDCKNIYNPDVDLLIKQKVDLVLTTTELPESEVKKLQKAGITVLTLKAPTNVEEIYSNLSTLATLFEGAEKATLRLEQLEFFGNAMTQQINNGTTSAFLDAGFTSPPTALWIINEKNVATGDSLEGEFLTDMGFLNVAQSYENYIVPEGEKSNFKPDYLFYSDTLDIEKLKASDWLKGSNAVAKDALYPVDVTAFERKSPRMFTEMFSIIQAVFPTYLEGFENVTAPYTPPVVVEKNWFQKTFNL